MIDWNDFAKDVHQTAVDKGWWDKPVSFDDMICNCLVHLGRAYEQYRSGRPNLYHLCQPSGEKEHPCEWDLQKPCPLSTGELACEHRDRQPHGAAVEMADCVLRLLDYLATTVWEYPCYPMPVQLEDTFTGFICSLHFNLTCARAARFVAEGSAVQHITHIISMIWTWAAQEGVDLESILRSKHEYNKTRPYRHGGKVL